MRAGIRWSNLARLLVCVCGGAWMLGVSLQAATVSTPTAPSGFSALPTAPNGFSSSPTVAPATGGEGRLLDGFTFTTSLGMTYDSNVTQSPGPPLAPVETDFFINLGGSVNYLSKASRLTFGGNYHCMYNQYFSQTDFSGFNQGAGVTANYDGGNFTITGQAGVEFNHGANRNYGSALVDQTAYNVGLSARYRLSPKTSITGDFSDSFSTTSGSFSQTQNVTLGAAALWKYSALTEFGPGVRTTYSSQGNGGGRTSIGPTLSMNYKLSTKVSLNSQVGMNFASYENGGTADPTVSALIALDYKASRLWGLNFSLFKDTQADSATAGLYSNITSVRLGYHRKIRRATLNLGLNYDTNTYTVAPASGSAPPPAAAPDRNFYSLDASLGMLILGNTSYASIFVRYNNQENGRASTWDGFQSGISINRSF